ncbi:MAG: phospholipid carrier-dependent glycosyltransferase [Nitrospirota bacterium]
MTSAAKQTGRLEMRDLIILTVLICILFTFMLENRPLSVPDEGRYVEIPREMVASGNYLTPRLNYVKYFEKPVLFYWLEAFSIKLFGLNEFTLRLWPALFALFGCLALAVAGARLFGRMTGLLSAAVLATSLLYYGLGRAIILDMPVSILLTLALLSFLVGSHEAPGLKRRLYLWGFYAFAALAVLTKGLIGIFIPAMVIGAWILLLGEWRMLKTLYIPSGLALFLLIAAPWHIMVDMANPEFFQFYFIHEHFQRFLTRVHGRYKPFWYFIPIVLLGLFPWSAFLLQAIKHSVPSTWRERHEHRDALFFLLWAGLVFLFFSASSSKLAPYILPVFPPLALLIGRYLAAAWDSRDFPGLRAGYSVFLVASLLLAAAFFVLPYYWPISAGPQPLGIYRYTIAFTLAIGGAAAWGLMRSRNLRRAFIAVAVTSALFLTQVNAAAPRVDTKSVKQLAIELKARLRPGDEVASYQEYYQDLPVYLERRITVVDWGGELNFGNSVEDTKAWMIDSATFWKRWQGPTTMYMLTPIENYETLKRSEPNLPLFPVDRNQRTILLSNREVKP